MNSRIQQIMAMHKAGILTDEQSAQLIEELLKTQTGPAGAAARVLNRSRAAGPLTYRATPSISPILNIPKGRV